jgi:predicted hotdog family 3-hydroxylacyl-ACP dehydratase
MCLLDEVIEWDARHIRCRTATHRLPDHPLRSQNRLGVACGIEYAAQSMAVHGALAGGALTQDVATGTGAAKSEVGFLARLRDVELQVARLDDIDADLIAEAGLIAGDHGSALYEFAITAGARRLLSGRATVVFDVSGRLTL